MKERPILFSTEMVLAILAGRKMQTRRVVKPYINEHLHLCRDFIAEYDNGTLVKCHYGKVGDVLWVRETWNKAAIMTQSKRYDYKADYTGKLAELAKLSTWKPSIHMPKDACRLKLRITDIRVERLKDISEADAMREVVAAEVNSPAIYSFYLLWQSINGEQSWKDNPWVWVIEFEKL